MPRPRTTLVLALAAAVLAAGCGADEETPAGGDGGGGSAEQQVRKVVASFGVATREKDYQEICDRLLADELVQKIEAVGLPCEGALQRGLGEVEDPTLEINDVSINRDRALVSIHTTAAGQAASDDALQLVRQGNEWKIASLAAPEGEASSSAPSTTPSTTPTHG